ncbi:YigZ family protein [Tindallia californiensis]|uniref:Uncharacterized protein, YigZ family n=1 Tax=Tindallia californiensis TaxID=159292 RepID=A0A1H3NC06_9FIRM|nr:YigZ family protein [Tindallia californiensis]SDY85739.1 uncharacterized protein, YigZ family [Tindallia californiensis]
MSDITSKKSIVSMKESYKTIKNEKWHRVFIEKSEFIAYVASVENTSQTASVIEYVKNKCPNATHYVYAYSLGIEKDIQKYDDDGEPSGTAGMPILEIIRNRELKNLIAVVVRYFGGKKLGTGGLKRAYSRTALSAIEEAVEIEKKLYQWIQITVDYSFWGKIEYFLQKRQILIEPISFTDRVSFKIPLPVRQVKMYMDKMIEITGDIIEFNQLDIEYLENRDPPNE